MPTITLHGLEKTFYQENEPVTVTCEIPRVKPKPPADSVRFRWGGEDIPMPESTNLDSTFRYIGSKAKMLSRDDNGKLVRCDITTANGTLAKEEKSLVVHCKYSRIQFLIKRQITEIVSELLRERY